MYDDDSNYHNDHRVRAGSRREKYLSFDEEKMEATYLVENEEGEENEVTLPMKYEVCDTCDGRGKHVNPSIDSHGITGEEWAEWDPEDREHYLSGRYDVTCYECAGKRVTPAIDTEQLSEEQQGAFKYLEERY